MKDTTRLTFVRAAMVGGDYHDAGTTAAVADADALTLVRRGVAVPADQAKPDGKAKADAKAKDAKD